jgi:hypothetical protein
MGASASLDEERRHAFTSDYGSQMVVQNYNIMESRRPAKAMSATSRPSSAPKASGYTRFRWDRWQRARLRYP